MARKTKADAALVVPPFYIATADLHINGDAAGVMPVAAYRAGDQVPVPLVEQQGWQDQVRLPDGYAAEEDAAEDAPEDEPVDPPADSMAADDAAGKE